MRQHHALKKNRHAPAPMWQPAPHKIDAAVWRHAKDRVCAVRCLAGQRPHVLRRQGWQGQRIGLGLSYENYKYLHKVRLENAQSKGGRTLDPIRANEPLCQPSSCAISIVLTSQDARCVTFGVRNLRVYDRPKAAAAPQAQAPANVANTTDLRHAKAKITAKTPTPALP